MPGKNLSNRAIITIYSRLPKRGKFGPNRYMGVVELAETGFNNVEVVVPTWAQDFPSCPFMATVPTNDTFVEFRKDNTPILNVDEWEPLHHYYY